MDYILLYFKEKGIYQRDIELAECMGEQSTVLIEGSEGMKGAKTAAATACLGHHSQLLPWTSP